MIVNVHERRLPATPEEVGALLDRFFTPEDHLWPAKRWPMPRSGELRTGAACHHADVRYTVAEYEPGERVWFAFTGIDLHGGHGFDVVPEEAGTVLRHTLRGSAHRSMRVVWPLIIRPIHDALLEDLLDNAERELTGTVLSPHRYSRWVRILRAIDSKAGRRGRAEGVAAALALAALAGVHAYWARGGLWPGDDPASLGETVVGPGAVLPSSGAVWAVAGLLGASAAGVATTAALRHPPAVARAVTRVTAGALLARGVAGIPASVVYGLDTRFGRLNAVLYSPLCVVLSRGVALAGRSAR